ncbi:unnamed protein product [Ectocarpus sp. CCAP 1310/34]|nr:unnamed protein product [Ectocarpus sp. CCAP 1310/34]
MLKLDDDDEEAIVLEHLRDILVEVLDKKGDRSNYNNFRGILLLSHVGKVPMKIITNRLSAFCETNNILPEEQCGFRPGRSTIDMMFVVRRLQELGRRRKIPLYMCFVDLKKAVGIPEEMNAVIRQFHDGMRVRVRVDDGEFSAWFWVTEGLRQGCVLSSLLFNIFFAAVIDAVAIRFSEDDVILQNLVYLEEETGAGARTPLDRVRRAVWGMLYADDAGVVSRSAEGLARMMTVIVEVFEKFGLTVSEKKTETLLIGAKNKQTTTTPPPPSPLIIEAAGQREINYQSRAAWACIRRYGQDLFDKPNAPFRLKTRLLQAEAMEALLYGCMTWAPRQDQYRTLRTIHHRLLLRVIGYQREKGTYRQLSYAQTLKRVGCQSVETTIRQRRLLFAGALARQPDGRLPKRVMLGELVGGEAQAGGNRN